MTELHQIKNTNRSAKRRKRVGRGIGSGMGKTCCRGQKGQGARSGSRRRWGKEGGAMPLFMKTPIRGFSQKRFQKRLQTINLAQLDRIFSDGDKIHEESLRQHGFFSGKIYGIKLLGQGELTKKVQIEVDAITEGAKTKLDEAQVSYTLRKR